MNQLYTCTKKQTATGVININKRTVPKVNSQMIYLASLSREDDNLPTSYKLITPIENGDKKLYVLQYGATFYLSDEFNLNNGIANILYSSKSLKRTTGYAEKLIGK